MKNVDEKGRPLTQMTLKEADRIFQKTGKLPKVIPNETPDAVVNDIQRGWFTDLWEEANKIGPGNCHIAAPWFMQNFLEARKLTQDGVRVVQADWHIVLGMKRLGNVRDDDPRGLGFHTWLEAEGWGVEVAAHEQYSFPSLLPAAYFTIKKGECQLLRMSLKEYGKLRPTWLPTDEDLTRLGALRRKPIKGKLRRAIRAEKRLIASNTHPLEEN